MAHDDELSDLELGRRLAFANALVARKDPNPNEMPEPEYVALFDIQMQETKDDDAAWDKFLHDEMQRLIDLRAPRISQPVNMPVRPKGEGN